MASDNVTLSDSDIDRLALAMEQRARARVSGDNPPGDLRYNGSGRYYSPSTGLHFIKAGFGSLMVVNEE
jgi:hypothetical protein